MSGRRRGLRPRVPQAPERHVDTTRSIQERFEAFHEANPDVYDELVRYTREMLATGRRAFGIEMPYGKLRWERNIRTSDPSSTFKLNDHYTSRYARLIMRREPDLEGVFETRRLRS